MKSDLLEFIYIVEAHGRVPGGSWGYFPEFHRTRVEAREDVAARKESASRCIRYRVVRYRRVEVVR